MKRPGKPVTPRRHREKHTARGTPVDEDAKHSPTPDAPIETPPDLVPVSPLPSALVVAAPADRPALRVPNATYAELIGLIESAPSKAGLLLAFARRLASPDPEHTAAGAADALLSECCAAAGVEAEQLGAWIHAAAARRRMSNPWGRLEADLEELGPRRVAIAMHAARAAAGGPWMSEEEEDAIAGWFVEQCVDVMIERGGVRAAAAIWYVLIGDWQRDPHVVRPPRCPAVAACPCPPFGIDKPENKLTDAKRAEIDAFLTGIRVAAEGFVHAAVAGGSAAEHDELRDIMRAEEIALDGDVTELECYRPWGQDLVEDRPASEMLDHARRLLTQRRLSNDDASAAIGDWAHGFAETANEHTLPPVCRIGAVAWFARVALQPEERTQTRRSRGGR